MGRQVTTIAGLALASSVLACFVPGISDASGPGLPLPTVSASGSVVAGSVGSADVRIVFAAIPVTQSAPATAVPSVAPVPRRRIPVGCERAVSPLARSVEASQIARCVT